MITAWMIYALAIGALISIAAASAEWALKSAQRPVRFVWVTAIALTLAFTVLAPLRVKPTAPAAPRTALMLPANVVVTEAAPTAFENFMANSQAALQMIVLPVERAMSVAGAAPKIVNRTAAAAWFISSAIALTLLLAVYAHSKRASTRWPRMNILGRNVRVAPDVGPAVIGMAPPEIVIPQWVLKRHEDEQRLVLEHEAEHVRAHDPLLLLFACVAVALMPWHAALWFMWSRLRLAVEVDCDRRVLNRGVQKPAYGELLVELSSQRPWNSLAMPAFSWGTSHLEKRLVAMTSRPARYPLARRAFSAGVVALSLVAACRSELPTATEIADMDATKVAARMRTIADTVVMTVDGQRVSEADAKAIPAGDIASVEVLKRGENRPVAEIRINLLSDSARKENESKKKEREQFKIVPDSSANVSIAAKPVSDTVMLFRASPSAAGSTSNADVTSTAQPSDSGPAKVVLAAAQPCVGTPGNLAVSQGNQTGARVRVRGQSSIALDCEPLTIIDGVIVDRSSIDGLQLNPDRIESIEVIKGPAAVGKYGSRAANGVIFIKLRK